MLTRLVAVILGPAFAATHPVLDHDARLVLTPRFGGFKLPVLPTQVVAPSAIINRNLR
jgi:hypothetical protein